MSSSARAVRLGRPPGIFLLTKWMTCSRTGALPVVAGGRRVCALAKVLSAPLASRWALKPQSIMTLRTILIVSGLVALRNIIEAALPALKRFLPMRRSRSRIAMVTSPKSMSTGQGDSHLWHTVQCPATSANSSQWRIETPRRVCSSYRKASISSDTARILLRGEYSRLARGTCVAQTGLHLPQRRQSLIASEIEAMSACCMISDSWPIRLNEGV